MPIVPIIRQIIATAIKINRKYKYININDKFVRKYVPPGYRKSATRIIRISEAVAVGIPIYEGIQEIRRGKKIRYPQARKTRNSNFQTRKRFGYGQQQRYPYVRKRYGNRCPNPTRYYR